MNSEGVHSVEYGDKVKEKSIKQSNLERMVAIQ